MGQPADYERVTQIRARITEIRDELNALLSELGEFEPTERRRRLTVVKG